MNQKQQIERGDLKNNSYSDTTNRERCPQEHLWFRHYKQKEVSSKTTLNQTLQIERGVLKNLSYSDTKNRERCPQKHP